MKHISYPKITQFRNVVSSINRQITYTGDDVNGDPMYDPSIPKPTIEFKGTVKLHGTNAGICYNEKDGIWVQSRTNIITPQKDNEGFASFVESNESIFKEFFTKIHFDNNITDETISIFGEWAGGKIQKGVGISNIPKSLFIFGVEISNSNDPDFESYWVDFSNYRSPYNKIYNINDYGVFHINIDFNMPQLVQNELGDITKRIEEECPVAKAFGFSGVGEGVVWSTNYKGITHKFKVKGEKHSVSKVKKLASVDVEKLESINEFIEYAVTENRFNQAIQITFGSNKEDIDIKKMGDLIRWMVNDISKEEIDTMSENNLEPKDVNKYISTKTREMFFALKI